MPRIAIGGGVMVLYSRLEPCPYSWSGFHLVAGSRWPASCSKLAWAAVLYSWHKATRWGRRNTYLIHPLSVPAHGSTIDRHACIFEEIKGLREFR